MDIEEPRSVRPQRIAISERSDRRDLWCFPAVGLSSCRAHYRLWTLRVTSHSRFHNGGPPRNVAHSQQTSR